MAVSATQALRALLLQDLSLRLRWEQRVYIGRAPQADRRPFAVLTLVNTRREWHLRGGAGVAWPSVQVDIVADSEAVGAQLADLARLKLDAYRGGVTVDGDTVILRHVTLESESDESVLPQDGSDGLLFVRTQTYQVVLAEAVAR